MKIVLMWVGATTVDFVKAGVGDYISRLKHYIPFEVVEIANVKIKQPDINTLRIAEGKAILNSLKSDDYLILLDDKGKEYTSVNFAQKIEKLSSQVRSRVVFVIGGAYGFSQDVYNRANELLSLSRMTFSHQMIRVIIAEQLYRAMTILKGEQYHHEESLLNKKNN